MLVSSKISKYMSQYGVTWRLTMPPGCPPEDIEIPHDHSFLRLTHNIDGVLSEQDLLSYSELQPNKNWGNNIVLSKGLSLSETIDKAKRLLKLPNIRKQKFNGIAEICLTPTDCVVKQTGVKGHYTWWLTTSYHISNHKPIEL